MKKQLWGLTGGIATGKSTILNYIQKHSNIKVINTDQIGHVVIRQQPIIDRLVKEFGEEILIDGQIDRKTLGKIVFADKESLKKLNEITHPEIRKLLLEEIEKYIYDYPVIVEMAILFEAGWEDFFDKIVLIMCHPMIQYERLKSRDNLTTDQIIDRINSNLLSGEKMMKSDYIIHTTHGFDSYEDEIKNLIKKLDN